MYICYTILLIYTTTQRQPVLDIKKILLTTCDNLQCTHMQLASALKLFNHTIDIIMITVVLMENIKQVLMDFYSTISTMQNHNFKFSLLESREQAMTDTNQTVSDFSSLE